MTDAVVRAAYARRAAEYAAAFGAAESAHEDDRALIARWAASVSGPILDAGCGPGHWTAFLAAQGADVSGVDLVPAFVERARAAYPAERFAVGSIDDLPAGEWAGVLCWYSLIHTPPPELPGVLSSVVRAVRPGGSVLVGFFDGDDAVEFAHAVTPAYYWSVPAMSAMLADAGCSVMSLQQRADAGARPHAAIIARRE